MKSRGSYEVMYMKLQLRPKMALTIAALACGACGFNFEPVRADTIQSTSVTSTSSTASPAAPLATTGATTTSTTTTSTTTAESTPALRTQPIEQTVRRSIELQDADLQPERIRRDKKLANRLAKSHWLEKAAAEDPEIIAAITQYSGSARILARHPRLGHIAEYDHYLCRQLTKWKGASRTLAKNPEAQAVIYYDPEGIYRAIKVDRTTARSLSRNTEFAQMVIDNPDLAKVLASYM